MSNCRDFREIVDCVISQAIDDLSGIESNLSGDDSALSNCWEEICAQVQWEQSHSWDVYVMSMDAVLEGLTAELSDQDRTTLALETEAGCGFGDGEIVPIAIDQIVELLRTDHLLEAARTWTNENLKAYGRYREQFD